jgi:hypothetical protein
MFRQPCYHTQGTSDTIPYFVSMVSLVIFSISISSATTKFNNILGDNILLMQVTDYVLLCNEWEICKSSSPALDRLE